MEKSFTHHGEKLVELLKPKQQANQVIDFQDAMANLTFETICDIAFGVEPGSVRFFSFDIILQQQQKKKKTSCVITHTNAKYIYIYRWMPVLLTERKLISWFDLIEFNNLPFNDSFYQPRFGN